VTINVADSLGVDMLANTPAGEKANTITFTSPTYVFTSGVCIHGVAFGTAGQCALVSWSPRTAGQTLGNIYITAVNGAGVPTRLHASQNVNRSLQFGLSCHDPVANAGVQATFSATAASLSLCKSNGAIPTSWTAAVALTFAAGSPSVGPYSFNYNDVGKVDLWMRNGAATSETGSSGVFVVKPAGFTLSNITRSSDGFANPATSNAAGTLFLKAGEAFSVTVTARNAGGTITPNFGQEAVPETVKLSPVLVAGLGLANNPALNGTFGNFGAAHPSGAPAGVAGVAHGIAFSWDEVGVITLTSSVGDGTYLGAGDVLGTPSGNVGRFGLGKFLLQNVTFDERADLCQGGFLVSDGVTPCASNFTYMDEQIDINFSLVPASLNGAIVLNYVDSATPANDFAKLDPSTFANLNLAAVDRTTAGGPYYLTSRLSNGGVPATTCATALCFGTGVASLNVPFKFSRNISADGAYAGVELGIAPVDGDGARVEGVGAVAGLCNNPNAVDCYDMDVDAVAGDDRASLGIAEFRHGRSRIASMHGSELLPLRLQVMTEYWSGGAYVASVDDSLSILTIGLGNYQKNLASGETLLTQPLIVSGSGQIGLSRPGAGNNGSVDVTVTSPAYLPGNTGRATFGVFKGSNEFIYLREAY
jgi:MSHA biogenesis protein MshQ